ncbi:MAG: VWA domain-containing protein, partial [Planctomycetota bacterium]
MPELAFTNPKWLLLLWLVPLVAGLWLYCSHRVHVNAERLLSSTMRRSLEPKRFAPLTVFRCVLFNLALTLLAFAIAEPTWGEVIIKDYRPDIDVMVLLDVSRSMETRDDEILSRLERAKASLREIASNAHGARLGLTAFAGTNAIVCPMTRDYEFFKETLDKTGPGSIAYGGTLIGDAIRKAIAEFEKSGRHQRVILLLTDGEDHESLPIEAATEAKTKGLRIFTVGFGDPNGNKILVRRPDGSMDYLKHDGKEVLSRLDEGTLRTIASLTDAQYVPPQQANQLADFFMNTIAPVDSEAGRETTRREPNPVGSYFALAALGVLFFFYLLPLIRSASDASIRLDAFARAARRPAVPAIILSILIGAASPAFAQMPDGPDISSTSTGVGLESIEPDPDGASNGFKLLEEKDYVKAADAFYAGALARPQHREYLYLARGYALYLAGDKTNAELAWRQSSGALKEDIAVRTRYNLGVLMSDILKDEIAASIAKLPVPPASDKPAAPPGADDIIDPDARQRIIEQATLAQRAFRHCLDLDPNHADARRSLSVLRLWAKDIVRRWADADRKRAREQMDLAAYADYLLNGQRALLNETLGTESLELSAARDAVALDASRTQRQLADDSAFLKPKLLTAFAHDSQSQTPAEDDPEAAAAAEQREAIKTQLEAMCAQIESLMSSAAIDLKNSRIKDAIASQTTAIEQLELIWLMATGFEPSLDRATNAQSQIIRQMDSILSPSATATHRRAFDIIRRDQSSIGRLVETMPEKAKQEAGFLKQRQDESSAQSAESGLPSSAAGATKALRPSEKEYIDARIRWLNSAELMLPDAATHIKDALTRIDDADMDGALAYMKKASDIFDDIISLKPKQEESILSILRDMIVRQWVLIGDSRTAHKTNDGALLENTAAAQKGLAEQTAGLKDKLNLTDEEKEAHGAQLEGAVEMIRTSAFAAAESLSATGAFDNVRLDAAILEQRAVLDGLEQLWLIYAPTGAALERAAVDLAVIRDELKDWRSYAADSVDPDALDDLTQLHDQSTMLASVVPKKAEAEMEQMTTAAAAAAMPGAGGSEPDAQTQQQQQKYIDWLKRVQMEMPKASELLTASRT